MEKKLKESAADDNLESVSEAMHRSQGQSSSESCNDNVEVVKDPVESFTETDSGSQGSQEDPAFSSHWKSLTKTTSKTPSPSRGSRTHHSSPATKDLKVQLKKLDERSPPITQKVYNEAGQLVGRRVYTKYAEGYKKTSESFDPPKFSTLSPAISPFSQERKGKGPMKMKSTEMKEVTSPSECGSPVGSLGDVESPQLNLHLDSSVVSEASASTKDHDEPGTGGQPDVKASGICDHTTVSESPLKVHGKASATPRLKEISSERPCIMQAEMSCRQKQKPRTRVTTSVKLAIKKEARHLDAIDEIINCPDHMSASQMITILDKLNLKPDTIYYSSESLFTGIIKQMQIAGAGLTIKGTGCFRRMLAQHLVYETDYYKLIGDTFLNKTNQTFEQYCSSLEQPGTDVTAMDVFAAARFINCRLRIVGANDEWTNEVLVPKVIHKDVWATIIVNSPGVYSSTKINLGRLSKRGTMAEVLQGSGRDSSLLRGGSVTLDVLSAPTGPTGSTGKAVEACGKEMSETDVGVESRQHGEHSTSADLTGGPSSPIQPTTEQSMSPGQTTPIKRKRGRPRTCDSSVGKKSASKKSPSAKNASTSPAREHSEEGGSHVHSRSGPKNARKHAHSPDPDAGTQKRPKSSKDYLSTPARNTRQAARVNQSMTPSSITSQRTLQKRTASDKSASIQTSRSAQRSAHKSSCSDKRSGASSIPVARREGKSPVRKSSAMKAGNQSRGATSSTSTSSTSSDETDFSSLNVESLSSKDTKYFLKSTISAIDRLKLKLNKAKSKYRAASGKGKPSACASTTTLNKRSPRRTTSKTDTASTSASGFQCHECKRIFNTRKALESHKATHKRKRYACQICGRKFFHYSSLCTHKKEHKMPALRCDKCHKTFARKDKLKIHVLTHLGEFKFLCSICGKGFTSKAHYEGHMVHHANVKPHKCQNCNNSFHYRTDLRHHTRNSCAAAPESSVPCDICGQLFKCKKYMRNHRKRHDDVEKFTCELCGKIFISEYFYRNHIAQCGNNDQE